MTGLIALIKKELILTFRDIRMRFIVLAAPVIQLIVFGYVATTEIRNITLSVNDHDQSQASRDLVNSFLSSGYFMRIDPPQSTTGTAAELLKKGTVKVVMNIPPDFSANIDRNATAEIFIQADGSDANSATITKSYIEEITYAYVQKILGQGKVKTVFKIGQGIAIEPAVRILYNPALKSSHYMVPGIICLILLMITALLTAMAITKEKELGTLEQILVSPLRRWIFVLGKTLPFVLVGFIEVLLILGVAKLLFDIPIRGNLFLLFFCSILFLFTTLGLGLFGASVSKTQTQAMLTVFPIIMPAFLLSGFFFPVASIPAALRWIAYINPLTYFMVIARGILLKGSGFPDIYREMLMLVVFGVFFIVFSSLRIRKRID